MAKPGRNHPCPSGSGNKYKKCCLTKDEATGFAQQAESGAARDERAGDRRLKLQEFKAAIAAKLAGAEDADVYGDDLMDASNAVVDLVRTGKLDDAEAAARDLLARYPDEHDGYDRLGMVHEARGENTQAADCYRKVLACLRAAPGDYDPAFEENFVRLIAKLDPPAAT